MQSTNRNFKFSKVDIDSLSAPESILKAWAVTDVSTGEALGFVASAVQTHTIPRSGNVYSPVKWGFAVDKDEFRSGIQFLYNIRLQAANALLRSHTA